MDQPLSRSVLFVCTGNTCRSPLAEKLFKKMLAEKLGCSVEQLPARGYIVRSAGVAAYPGDSASEYSLLVGQEFGIDLSQHRSQPVNAQLLEEATDVVAMTGGHAAMLFMRFPSFDKDLQLLGGNAGDLPDPIGGDLDLYRECAKTIQRHLERILAEWLVP
jgi:protein-tyrosine-phosphatase